MNNSKHFRRNNIKNFFKAFIIMILSITLCLHMQSIVKASTYTDLGLKKDVSISKSWTVNFNKALSATTINATNIMVVGQNNEHKDISVSLANGNKAVIVKPIINYEPNKTYTIIVTVNVKSTDGKPFPKEVRMSFITKSEPVKYKIVLDAGHGGNDPGAIGPTGLKEKDVTLAITLKVGSILVKNGVETIYTRTTDNIPWSTNEAQNLQARCDISNSAKPNYFVSIHENSFSAPSATGIETYYFTGSVAGQKLAQAVQTELVKVTGNVDRKIKTTSGLYVIKHVDATSILVESAFISNPEDERLLATQAYQYTLAKAIATGILKTLGISNIVY
ncbi:N-acetylmuramoyl-L-alanine amidase [Clostridium bowmanii]|uniref:N-acetylmuramoyl-L-alanine amidase n=1 Tax=Clostridium bowmanii TaxID=132925 RepID=UPI001C0BB796|nr:N-acetylmuramoyl-L-alanine amidase [Clostridium bowmanii]MBU3189489.1 N-acetylmuramoyl-L-alanine amidase [Clostridium bowmanii]MCA1074102.1 N-acetylmuramoyl-L-alanine amidase [Clostridium bowmanii]